MPHKHTLTALLYTGLLIAPAPAGAQTTPIVGSDTPVGGPDLLGGLDGALGSVTGAFSSVDSTIAMLSRMIDICIGLPVIGPLAATIKPVLNTYLDFKVTLQPLLDAANTGRSYVQKAVGMQAQIQRIFQDGDFEGTLNTVNDLVGELGGLTNLPPGLRNINVGDPRGSMQNLLAAADSAIAQVRAQQQAARAQGDPSAYRTLARKEQELGRVRERLRHAGNNAGVTADNKKLVEAATAATQATAAKTQGFTDTLGATQSAEGALKALGTIALESMNANGAALNSMSQQLALISQGQTTSNDQSEQLLAHFEEEAQLRTSQIKAILDADKQQQLDEYNAMLKKSQVLSDSIGQSMAPSRERRSSYADLMKGKLP